MTPLRYPTLLLLALSALAGAQEPAIGDTSVPKAAPLPQAESVPSTSTLPAAPAPSGTEASAHPPAASADTAATAPQAYDLDRAVIRGAARPLTRKESDQVARMPLRYLENPQAYSVVPKELVSEQMAVDYNSAFKNIAGASRGVQWMQGHSMFYSRGFLSSTEVRNGLSVNLVTDIDPVNVERIEAIRGPAGALFGAGAGISYGGLFNRVTKAPFDRFKGEVRATGGSWNLGRVAADVNVPLNPEKTLLMRVNLARHNEGSFMDHGFSDVWAVAPSLAYKVNDRLTMSLDVEAYERAGTSIPQMWVDGTSARNIEDLGIGYRRSFLDNSLKTETRTANIFAKALYDLGGGWSSETMAAYTTSTADLASIYLGIYDDSHAVRYHDAQSWKVFTRQIQQNVRGEIKTGMFRNQILLGLGVSDYNYTWPYTVASDTVNYLDPGADYFVGMDVYRSRIAALPRSMWMQESYTYSAYASDAIHLGDRFTALLGIRWDRFDNRGGSDGLAAPTGIYEQDAFSPKAGLVFQPLPGIASLFANYMNGYKNVNGRSADGETFVPERAHQAEAGVKLQAPGGRVTGTVSVYGIQVADVVRNDPENPGFSIQNGSQANQGVELDLAAHPVAGLNLVAGFALNHSEFTRADSSIEGRRPPSAGPGVASNFWASYELQEGAARGLGLGVGMNYAGEAYHRNTDTFVFKVPEYLLWDAALFFDRPTYRLGLKVDNLTDRKYWSPEYLQAGPLRRVMGEVSYKF